jgi:hypothetical protein
MSVLYCDFSRWLQYGSFALTIVALLDQASFVLAFLSCCRLALRRCLPVPRLSIREAAHHW